MTNYQQAREEINQENEISIKHERLNRIRMLLTASQPVNASPLSRRETEIMKYIAEGKKRSAIAQELYIDLQTVKSHIRRIYCKLNVHVKIDAIKIAIENKYI